MKSRCWILFPPIVTLEQLLSYKGDWPFLYEKKIILKFNIKVMFFWFSNDIYWIYACSNICAQLWRDYLKFILFCSENCCPKKNRERILKRRNFRWVKNYLWRINNWFFVHSFMINKTKYDDTSFLPILGTEESAWIKVSPY